jgi:excisionase family DNA binding protein
MGPPAHGAAHGSLRCSRVVAVEADQPDLLSVREVADRLGVHPETIRRLIHEGRMSAVRVGRVLRVARADVELFVDRQRVKPTPRPRR